MINCFAMMFNKYNNSEINLEAKEINCTDTMGYPLMMTSITNLFWLI